jgi:hypothetical protein
LKTIQTKGIPRIEVPQNLDEFVRCEPNDGFKYEWNDGELIKFTGMKRKYLRLVQNLNNFLIGQKKMDN